ncbi:MAG: hypothetical protein ACLU9L_04735 [Christensenellales bacterium]
MKQTRDPRSRQQKFLKYFSLFVYLSLVASIIYIVVRIFLAPASMPAGAAEGERLKSDYVLMLLQCILGVAVLMLPSILAKRFRLEIPSMMLILFVLFLYCAVYLGEVQDFYYKVSNWDTILHCFSGGMLGTLGFSVIALFNNSDRIPVNLSPIFVAFFAFCFAMMLGTIWEIYEFTIDGLMQLNMQKYALENGVALVGRAAVIDTMSDLIVDAVGAFVIAVIGYISTKYKKGWLEALLITRKRDHTEKSASSNAAS